MHSPNNQRLHCDGIAVIHRHIETANKIHREQTAEESTLSLIMTPIVPFLSSSVGRDWRAGEETAEGCCLLGKWGQM